MKLINFKTHKISKIIGLVAAVIFVGLCAALKFGFNPLLSFNPADIPPITASPMNVSDIYAISYFRSNVGHDYSVGAWDGESCRSMKHYINNNMNVDSNNMPVRSQPTAGQPNINIYAPFDGTIISKQAEHTPIGSQIHIASAKNSHYFVILFHTDLLPSLHVGSKVMSGQQIGTIGPMDGIDVAYEAHLLPIKTVYMSIFQYMTPQAFAPFAALGYTPDSFVLSRAQADAKGYKCNGEQFTNGPQQSPGTDNAEGIVSLKPNPFTAIYDQQHGIGGSQNQPNQSSQQ